MSDSESCSEFEPIESKPLRSPVITPSKRKSQSRYTGNANTVSPQESQRKKAAADKDEVKKKKYFLVKALFDLGSENKKELMIRVSCSLRACFFLSLLSHQFKSLPGYDRFSTVKTARLAFLSTSLHCLPQYPTHCLAYALSRAASTNNNSRINSKRKVELIFERKS